MRALALVLASLTLVASPVHAEDVPSVPAIATPVTDLAGVLDPAAEESVAHRLVALREKTGVQMAVLTVDTTHGRPIEDYALDVFSRWGGGSATRNDGVLFVLAVGDRRNRLQLGYGIEAAISDAASYEMLAALRPDLQAGDHAAACRRIVDEVAEGVAHLTPEAAVVPPPIPLPKRGWAFVVVIMLAWLTGVWFMWPRGTALSTYKRKKTKKKGPPPAWLVWARKRSSLLTFVAAPGVTLVLMTLTGHLGFGIGYALAWYAYAGVGCISAMVLREGPVRRSVYGVFVVGIIVLIAWAEPQLELADGFAPGLLGIVTGLGATMFTAFFLPGFGSGSGSYSSSSSSGSSSWSSSSSSSSSSYSSSSSSSSSWSGGGGSSGGGGASSSW